VRTASHAAPARSRESWSDEGLAERAGAARGGRAPRPQQRQHVVVHRLEALARALVRRHVLQPACAQPPLHRRCGRRPVERRSAPRRPWRVSCDLVQDSCGLPSAPAAGRPHRAPSRAAPARARPPAGPAARAARPAPPRPAACLRARRRAAWAGPGHRGAGHHASMAAPHKRPCCGQVSACHYAGVCYCTPLTNTHVCACGVWPHPQRQTRAGCPARMRPAPRTARGCPLRPPPGRARPTGRLRAAPRAPRLSMTAHTQQQSPLRFGSCGYGQRAGRAEPRPRGHAASPGLQQRPAGRTGEAAVALAGRCAPATATRPHSRAPCGERRAGPGRGALTTRLTSGDFSIAAARPRPPMFSWLRKPYSSCAASALPPCASTSAPPAPAACPAPRQRPAARHARAAAPRQLLPDPWRSLAPWRSFATGHLRCRSGSAGMTARRLAGHCQ